jgi:S-DNA-T family DNA segregation ATPase FtsK/SpoIIIE
MFPDQWAATAPAEIARIVASATPGPAGVVDGWPPTVGDDDGTAPAPGLWRVGVGLADGATHLPFPVGVPLLDEAHLQVTTASHALRPAAEAVVQGLVARALRHYRPGLVVVQVWNAEQYSGSLPGLYPLVRTHLRENHRPEALAGLLGDLSRQVDRVHTRVLGDGARRNEPWRVAVLLGNNELLPDKECRALEGIAATGLACGICLVLVDVPGVDLRAPHEEIRFTDDRVLTSLTGRHVTVTPDPPPSNEQVLTLAAAVSTAYDAARNRTGTLQGLLPDQWGQECSAHGLRAPVGFVDGEPAAELVFGDGSVHWLAGGPTGTGKTNLLLAAVVSLAARYDPGELEFYLLDFKSGVSFDQFTYDPPLPHVRLVGTNIDDDPEFGFGLLDHLQQVMRDRARAFRTHQVTSLPALRAADPGGRWPRVVAVIDEFQKMFENSRDAATKQATQQLEDIARRGRSFGVHLVLASQDVSSIKAFWTHPGIWQQFTARMALPQARRVLDGDAAKTLPKYSAIFNTQSGAEHAHQVLRMPNASAHGALDQVRERAHTLWPSPPPVVFDGARSPKLADLVAAVPPGDVPRAVLGQRMDVHGSPAIMELGRDTGRNLAIIDANAASGAAALASVAESLAGQGEFFDLDLPAMAPDAFAGAVAYLLDEVKARRRGEQECAPLFVVAKAADLAALHPDRAIGDAWRKVLRSGPELGVHVLGWWRSPKRLKDLVLSSDIALDDFGVILAVEAQGQMLQTLIAPGMTVQWSPRHGRALWFDRSCHDAPKTIIRPDVEDA